MANVSTSMINQIESGRSNHVFRWWVRVFYQWFDFWII